MFTDSYGEQSCTAGRDLFYHRTERPTALASPKLVVPAAPIGIE